MTPTSQTIGLANTPTLDRHLLTPPSLVDLSHRFGQAPCFEIYPEILTVYWAGIADDRCDGLIIAHGDNDDSWQSCREQIDVLCEELALEGLAPWTVMASVGGTGLPADMRCDLGTATSLYRSGELRWVAFLDFPTLTSDYHAMMMIPREFDGRIYTFPFEEPAVVPGRAGEGRLTDTEERDKFRAEFMASPRIPAVEWPHVPTSHGVYAIYPATTSVARRMPPVNGVSPTNAEQPLYVGRTLDEDLRARLARHAERIGGAVNLELAWFEARFFELPDARLAYRAKQTVRDGVDRPIWQRSGFAL